MRKKSYRFKRIEDINEHLKSIEAEFSDKPEVCFQLITHIVNIRRQNKVESHYLQFKRLLEHQPNVLINRLNTRWLISICDTFIDFGADQEKANALVVSTYVNLVKMADTYISILSDQTVDNDKFSAHGPSNELWDGLTQFSIHAGDMFHNLNVRIDSTLSTTPILYQIWLDVFERMKNNRNLLSKIAHLYQGKDSFY